MDKQLHSEIDIDATPERVWQILTDFAAYPQWNPFLPKVTGAARVGERLKVRLEPPGGRGMTFRPTVLTADPDRQLRWLGRLLLPGSSTASIRSPSNRWATTRSTSCSRSGSAACSSASWPARWTATPFPGSSR